MAYGQSPSFSLVSGWYDEVVTLILEAGERRIHYTLDGSTPKPTSPLYNGPLTIDRTTVVRAIACQDGRCTKEVSHTYWIKAPTSKFPVISVALTPDALFHPTHGLYREGYNADHNTWKRPGANFWSKKELFSHVTIMDNNGEIAFQSNIGFRLFGGMSRLFPQKSFTLVAREQYGKKRIRYPVFGKHAPEEFKSLVFRNGGSDWGKSHFRDGLMISLLENFDLEKQDHQPVHVYLNGAYWGIYDIREKINRFFLEDITGTDKDSIDLLEHHARVKKGSASHYLRMLEYMRKNTLADDSVFSEVNRRMDTDNFMHYQIAQIYFDNKDAGGNIRYWRPKNPEGRWRWIIYDVDQGFGLHDVNAWKLNTLAFQLEPNGPSWPNPPWSTFILRKLLENETFKQRFISTFFDVLNKDFSPEKVLRRIAEFEQMYRPEISRHFERWKIHPETWENHLEILRTFAIQRPGALRTYLTSQFGLPEPVLLSIGSTTGGTVRVGERIVLSGDTLSCWYPSGWKIRVSARPSLGYRFEGWVGTSVKDWDLDIEWSAYQPPLNAVFSRITSPLAGKIIINEIGANNTQSGDWVELYNRSDESVDVTSWFLADAQHHYLLPTSVIPPGGYLVVCQNLKKFKHTFPGVPAVSGNFRFGLNKRKESILLYDYDGAIIDSVRYELTPMDTLFTLALLLPGLDNALPKNWESLSGRGTPGAGNPYYVESHIKSQQIYWSRVGWVVGLISVLSILGYWRWQKRRFFL